MRFLEEVNDLEEYRILDKKFAEYFKRVNLNSDAITKWFSDHPYPLCIHYSFEDGEWYDTLIYSKVQYYDFLERVIYSKNENEWFTWYFTPLKGVHRLKLRKCNDVVAMEQARKTFTDDLFYCTMCLLKDMGLPLNLVENGTVLCYERNNTIWSPLNQGRLIKTGKLN